MNTIDAINILYNLAKQAELPKGITGNEAMNYLSQIENAKKVLESVTKTEANE